MATVRHYIPLDTVVLTDVITTPHGDVVVQPPITGDKRHFYVVNEGGYEDLFLSVELATERVQVPVTLAPTTAIVAKTGGAPLRTTTNPTTNPTKTIAAGTAGTITSGPRYASNYWWYQVAFGADTGWVLAFTIEEDEE